MTERKTELDKTILNYAVQIDNESDSDSDYSDQSYSLCESPPKRRCQSNGYVTADRASKRRRQPNRTVKQAAVKLTTLATKRAQRKVVTCTLTSNSSRPSSDSSGSQMKVVLPESDDSDAVTTSIKSSIIIKTTSKAKRIQPT